MGADTDNNHKLIAVIYVRSPEHRAKMSAMQKGKTFSDAHRANISAAQLGRMKASLAPAATPTINDICWAAGLYEGDGSCGHDGHTSQHAEVQQVESGRWVTAKLRSLFGGSDLPVPRKKGTHVAEDRTDFRWTVTGARARGFLQTIYVLLSPRRQEQIRKALRVGEFA